MRYYLLMNYIVPIYVDSGIGSMGMTSSINGSFSEKQKFYKKDKLHTYPKTERLCMVSDDLILYKAFFDIDRGYFVIRAKERKLAYDIATIIRYIINIRNGYQPDDRSGNYFLQELKRLPQPNWDEKKMLAELAEYNPYAREVMMFDLKDGVYIEYDIFKMIPEVISMVHNDQSLINSMYHLLESRLIFAGFMTGSFYSSHYKYDRLDTPDWEMEKRYFEYRYRY